MNAPTASAARPSSPVEPLPADEEQGLGALLELFTAEELLPAGTSARRSDAARLRRWAQGWVRRATQWGAGPGGAWRAW